MLSVNLTLDYHHRYYCAGTNLKVIIMFIIVLDLYPYLLHDMFLVVFDIKTSSCRLKNNTCNKATIMQWLAVVHIMRKKVSGLTLVNSFIFYCFLPGFQQNRSLVTKVPLLFRISAVCFHFVLISLFWHKIKVTENYINVLTF